MITNRWSNVVRAVLLASLAALAPSGASAQTPADMPPLSWLRITGTHLDAVQADPVRYESLQGNGFRNLIDAWNGAVLDERRNRLVLWGGGHNDYRGNELYAFDVAALAWSRLNEPSPPSDCGDPNSDGTANTRHSYNGLAYIGHADRFFASGGALNCTAGGCGSDPTWTFDLEALAWADRMATGAHGTGCENFAAYDARTDLVYWGDTTGLYVYDYDANSWRRLTDDYLYGETAVVDPMRGRLVTVGAGEVASFDVDAAMVVREVWTTTGDAPDLGGSGIGMDYDPTTDRYVVWNGGAVYVLHPVDRAWTRYDVAGAPTATPNGVYGRFRYVPVVNAFIAVTATDEDVHFFKLSEGGMLPPPFDGGPGPDGGPGADVGAGVDGGPSGSMDGGPRSDAGPPTSSGGCGCRAAGRTRAPFVGFVLLALGCAALRRRHM